MGVEREVMKDMRVAAMYYYRTNRNQIGVRNVAAPPSAYTPVTINVPNGPNGPTTATLYNLNPQYLGLQDNVVDNQPYLDTRYDGLELSASKRLSHRWQMVTGINFGRNKGGLNNVTTSMGQSATSDLNDPNNTLYSRGIVGLDAKVGYRLSGSFEFPGAVLVAGSMISNGGAPYVSVYSASRAAVAPVVTLTRGSQNVFLSARGDERLATVTMADIRISRPFRFGPRRIVPTVDFFNIGNTGTPVSITSTIGGSYLFPTQIIAPRIIRVGFSMNF